MEKKVLIITPKFPPQNWVAVYRAYRLAKYLPKYGWKPYVLTVDSNYRYPNDPELLRKLPPEVEVHTARFIEPTVRGLKSALTNTPFTNGTETPQKNDRAPVPDDQPPLALKMVGSSVANAKGFVRSRWLENPDYHRTWYGPALRKARKLIKEHEIPLVFTTAPDFVGQKIASVLQHEGAKWVADFRDPSVYHESMHSSVDSVFRAQRDLERNTFANSDAVTTTSLGLGLILADMYSATTNRDFTFIPTGLDEDLLTAGARIGKRERPYLLFSGGYHPEYDPHFLSALALAVQDPGVRTTDVQLLVVGSFPFTKDRMLPIIEKLGITEFVEFMDFVPQSVLLQLLEGAMAGVIMRGPRARWSAMDAKAIEFIAMQKPVLASVPEISELRLRLSEAGLGIFLDGDVHDSAATLSDFILGKLPLLEVSTEACAQYTASRMAASFTEVFERTLGL